MLSSRDAVTYTVHDGAMCIHVDNFSVKIPQQLLNKSQFLMDALSVAEPSVTRKATLAAPKEWLQAWVVCYCNEEESLSEKDTRDLVYCLLVCFLRLACSSHRAKNRNSCPICVHGMSDATHSTSSLTDNANLFLFRLLHRTREGLSFDVYSLRQYPVHESSLSNQVVRAACRQLIFLPFMFTCRKYVAPWQPGCLPLIQGFSRRTLSFAQHR
jgi:hypothetical protein